MLTRNRAKWLPWLAMLGMALRVWVPPRTMLHPEQATNAWWPLVLCSGQGSLILGGQQHEHHHHHDQDSGPQDDDTRPAVAAQSEICHKRRDSGANAEAADSGGEFLFFSPGLGYFVSRDFQVYAFVQVPFYQSVDGVQLTARTGFVVGTSYRF